MELDRIDRKIIVALMADATVPLALLASQVGLSQTPCWKRVDKLKRAGIIKARVALVDPEAVGLGLTAFVSLSAAEQSAQWRDGFEALLSEMPEIMEAYQLAGSHDYVLRLVARDMADYERLRQRIVDAVPVREISADFVLRRVKAQTALPVDTVRA